MKLDRILDGYSLIVAMIVDAAILLACFIAISPGVIEAIGMGALAIAIVIFAVRAWKKGGVVGKVTWTAFAIVALFFDLSFVLVSTDTQTQNVTELQKLQSNYELQKREAAEIVSQIQQRYDDALKRGNSAKVLNQIDLQLQAAMAVKIEPPPKNDEQEHKKITAGALSTAIYDAASSGDPGRVSFLIVFLFLFGGLQTTIVTAANQKNETTEKREPRARPIKIEPQSPFDARAAEKSVRTIFASKKYGRSNRATPLATFRHYTKGQIDDSNYLKIIELLKSGGIIDKNGEIVGDEATALKWVMGRM